MDAHEPWYQVKDITYNEVKESLVNTLKYKLENSELLEKVINEIIKKDTDFGSYRGYYTFLHTGYKQQVTERYNYLLIKK